MLVLMILTICSIWSAVSASIHTTEFFFPNVWSSYTQHSELQLHLPRLTTSSEKKVRFSAHMQSPQRI